MGWHCEATRVLGPETSSQTKSEELPEIYKEHSELGRDFVRGPFFLSAGKDSARGKPTATLKLLNQHRNTVARLRIYQSRYEARW